jgi:hypothetical protein
MCTNIVYWSSFGGFFFGIGSPWNTYAEFYQWYSYAPYLSLELKGVVTGIG